MFLYKKINKTYRRYFKIRVKHGNLTKRIIENFKDINHELLATFALLFFHVFEK